MKLLYYVKLFVTAVLLLLVLAGCGTGGQSPLPTPVVQPTLGQPAPTTGAQPTTGQPAPTTGAQPTTGQPAPTTKPAATVQPQRTPIIGFNPKNGPAGTVVNVFGSGYVAGEPVKVRLGLPHPTGEVLTSAFADTAGNWNAQLIIPDRLPSGDIITTDQMFLVAMNDQNVTLASATFGFEAPAPQQPLGDPKQTVAALLSAISAQDANAMTATLAKPLRDKLTEGRPLFQILDIHGDALDSFEVGDILASEVMIVPATLHYHTFDEQRHYNLVVENNQWKIAATVVVQPQRPDPAASPMAAVDSLLATVQQDRSLRDGRAAFYLGGLLRESVESGKLGGANALLQEQNPFATYRVEREIASDGDQVYVQATLFYGANNSNGAGRIFTVSAREDGTWRVFKITPDDQIGKPDPGSGWLPLVRGDFNQDGIEETVYVHPSNILPQDGFGDPNIDNRTIVISELMIVQSSAEGRWTMLMIDRLGITADQQLGSFVSDAAPQGPEAFRLLVDPALGPFIQLLPLRADGHAYAQGVALDWNADVGAYRLVGGPNS